MRWLRLVLRLSLFVNIILILVVRSQWQEIIKLVTTFAAEDAAVKKAMAEVEKVADAIKLIELRQIIIDDNLETVREELRELGEQ